MKVACIQMNSNADMRENLRQALEMVDEAAKSGATFIATPECSDFLGDNNKAADRRADFSPDNHIFLPAFQKKARETGCWLLLGSIRIANEEGRFFNRSFLFTPDGEIAAQYDKIHMFDVDIESDRTYRESDNFTPGNRMATADIDKTTIGLSICYDMRFPELYTTMAQAGAEIFAIPAAFTVPTGKAHWEMLLRARAIENGAFVIAPAQVGSHDDVRQTWGHSIIVDPWGRILAHSNSDAPDIIYADLNLEEVAKTRASIPSLKNRRSFN